MSVVEQCIEDAREAVQRSDRLQHPPPTTFQSREIRELRTSLRALIQAVEYINHRTRGSTSAETGKV